ncbi:MAG: ribbon-helix-helix protein, CopG family [Smithella sp.]|nr:ribbon-helix-helix protein, CopG family [Smithella sp.]
MVSKSDLVRTQVFLEKNQKIRLQQIARKEGVSLSKIIRRFIDAQFQQNIYDEMHLAAERLQSDYHKVSDLTEMTKSLESDDFL